MIYQFDEVDERLELLPMAARRALDHAGRKLSLEAWTSLSVEVRSRIVILGAAATVDVAAIREAIAPAQPAAEEIDAVADPSATSVPQIARTAFGSALSDAVWSTLRPIDRYALLKIASRGRPERIAAAFKEIVGETAVSTHLGARGGARMVNVAEKAPTQRVAVASSAVCMNREAFGRLKRAEVAKGDVLGTARVAGILAAKRTPELIPLCHPIALSKVSVEFELDENECAVDVVARVEALDRTGVEMEALVAASVAALTIYDMMKSIDRAMILGPTRLQSKTGGRSGDFSR